MKHYFLAFTRNTSLFGHKERKQPYSLHATVQGLRAVHESQQSSFIRAPPHPDEIVFIDCHTDPLSKRGIVIWDDILLPFGNALFVKHEAKILPLLRGPDLVTLVPHRIAAVPNVILDVVVGGELAAVSNPSPHKRTVQDFSCFTPEQEPMRPRRDPVGGDEAEAMQNYNTMDIPVRLRPVRPNLRVDLPTPIGAVNVGISCNPTETGISLSGPNIGQDILMSEDGLGTLYQQGHGVHRDPEYATSWYLKATGQGSARSQYNLGLWYLQRHNSAQTDTYEDDSGAGESNKSGQDNGSENSESVQQERSMAIKWLLKSANQGFADAQFELALIYSEDSHANNNDPETLSKTLDWLTKAAEQGHAFAQASLATMYIEGNGVSKDEAAGMEWLIKSASQGNVDAQYLLGRLYEEGVGVPRNVSSAKEWYQKAADQGSEEAESCLENLGVLDL